MKESKEFWNKIAARYAKSSVRDEDAYQKKLALTQDYLQPSWSILEFGCGTGSTAIVHAPYVSHILATDLSDRMLEIAEEKAEAAGIPNIQFQQGTLDSLALEENSFDAVLGLNILHLLEDVDGAISRVHSLLKPGGVFVSSTALVNEISVLSRLLIPLMQTFGFAPYLNRIGRQGLVDKLVNSGFSIEHEWQPGKDSVLIIAKKQS